MERIQEKLVKDVEGYLRYKESSQIEETERFNKLIELMMQRTAKLDSLLE